MKLLISSRDYLALKGATWEKSRILKNLMIMITLRLVQLGYCRVFFSYKTKRDFTLRQINIFFIFVHSYIIGLLNNPGIFKIYYEGECLCIKFWNSFELLDLKRFNLASLSLSNSHYFYFGKIALDVLKILFIYLFQVKMIYALKII